MDDGIAAWRDAVYAENFHNAVGLFTTQEILPSFAQYLECMVAQEIFVLAATVDITSREKRHK